MKEEQVEFEGWEKVLRETVPAERQRGYREAVIKFRYWLKKNGKRATGEVFREHLAWKKTYLSEEEYGLRREALRWYWAMGRKGRGEAGGAGAGRWGGKGGARWGGRVRGERRAQSPSHGEVKRGQSWLPHHARWWGPRINLNPLRKDLRLEI